MNRTPVADWQQLSALYELADTLAPDALGDWLAQLRQEAHPLLAQLEQMLEARSQIQRNGFLGALPHLPAPLEPRVTTWQAGSRIGPYRLLRKIGSGGMAEVWLAQRDDGAFQRQVAIKLPFRHAGSDALDTFAQRFARERDILASLDHPHIAGLHDAGVTPNGQPWLALEYVEGQALTSWCDARCLTIEARVRLFRQVLLAVQHAHANLVIHRDLKPGNILVTANGEVRLLDFGIAKLMESEGGALAETELTRIAGRPMTPQYASPEQLMGQPLTTACDVYSLGVVLYELLCGERPYELKMESTAQLEQAILDAEPRAPSRRALTEPTATARATTGPILRKQLASDLDAIVLRALAKQPTQRYGSVEAMRADLDRWLGGEPVEARAPSTVYRVGKFVRRHVLSVSLGVGAVVALLGVTVVAVVMGLQARDDSARAVAARDFMLNIFQRADQEKSRGADITARDLLETGRKDVIARFAGQPRLQTELLQGIARIQSDMGEYASADSTYAELVTIYGSLRQPREEAMARAYHALNADQMSDSSRAARLLQQAKNVADRPTNDPELEACFGEVEGWINLSQGNMRQAQDVLQRALRRAEAKLGEHHLRSFNLGRALVRADRGLGDVNAASVLLNDLIAKAPQVRGLDAKDIDGLEWERVDLLYVAGRWSQLIRAVVAPLNRCILHQGKNDQNCRLLRLRKVQSLVRLGMAESATGELASIRSIADDSTSPVIQAEALVLQFRIESLDRGRATEAQAVARLRAFGQSGPEVAVKVTFKANALVALAEERLSAADLVGARNWLEQAVGLLGSVPPAGAAASLTARAHSLLGLVAGLSGDSRRGIDLTEQGEAEAAQSFGSAHPITQLLALNNAVALGLSGQRDQALARIAKALPILSESVGSDAPTYARALALQHRLETAKEQNAMQPASSEFF